MAKEKKIYGMNDLVPYEPTHPGEVLKEELESRGISQRKFAAIISMPYTAFNEIVNGKRPVSTDLAIILETVLGIEAIFWINMQTRYNIQSARRDNKLIDKLQQIRKAAAVL